MQKAEYRNRKEGMETGRTEEEKRAPKEPLPGETGRREKKAQEAE
jgi:hypothetical protein